MLQIALVNFSNGLLELELLLKKPKNTMVLFGDVALRAASILKNQVFVAFTVQLPCAKEALFAWIRA